MLFRSRSKDLYITKIYDTIFFLILQVIFANFLFKTSYSNFFADPFHILLCIFYNSAFFLSPFVPFSTCRRGSMTWWPQPVHFNRKSAPTRRISHSGLPQGCGFFNLTISPTSYSNPIAYPSFLHRLLCLSVTYPDSFLAYLKTPAFFTIALAI